MTSTSRGAAAAACVLFAGVGQGSEVTLNDRAVQAVSSDAGQAAAARRHLREAGPRGLEALLETHAAGLSQPRSLDDAHERLHAAADAVAAQRHASSSGLYWYTDLEQAKSRARETGRPILSLRLLGRLDEELSCANSRFFRTVLYANREVSDVLRSRFVLHWSSERPAPRVTVDFGDGRRLETTLTGNSIHYVLDADGRPVDALPGLYGPRGFVQGLAQAEEGVKALAGRSGAERETRLRRYHRERFAALAQRWRTEVAMAGVDRVPSLEATLATPLAETAATRAASADRLALGKSVAERPILRSLMGASAVPVVVEDRLWTSLAPFHLETLDEGALRRLAEDGAEPSAVSALPYTMAEDTVRNEYRLHSRLHRWLSEPSTGPLDLDALNTRVYAELFLTPRADPWLGLVTPGVYTGLRPPTAAAR
jgi:hypothetical protein